jgi:lipopolysaccharide transport system ATP-binding protein
MGNVAKEGRTVLFVSHNMVAVNELCGIAILISKGEVCYSGKTGDVINHYLSSIIGSDSDFDRQGNGDIRISEVQLLLNNEIVRHIKLFDTIQILIGIIVNKYVSDCVIGIKILNMSNDIVFATNTELLGIENLNLLSGTENRYTFSIKNMPFKNGIYKLTVGIHPKGKGNKFSEYYDRVQDVITFTMYGDENDHGLVNLYTNFSRL